MRTLADVRKALNRRTTARWDEVPGVGEKWTTRLTRWMDEHVIVVKPKDSAAPSGSQAVATSFFMGVGMSRTPPACD